MSFYLWIFRALSGVRVCINALLLRIDTVTVAAELTWLLIYQITVMVKLTPDPDEGKPTKCYLYHKPILL